LLDGVSAGVFNLKNGLYRVYNGENFWGVGEIIDGALKMKSYVRDL